MAQRCGLRANGAASCGLVVARTDAGGRWRDSLRRAGAPAGPGGCDDHQQDCQELGGAEVLSEDRQSHQRAGGGLEAQQDGEG
jgi:hypothetical protein